MLIESLLGTRINNMNLIINNKLIYIRKLMLKKLMIKLGKTILNLKIFLYVIIIRINKKKRGIFQAMALI